MAYTYDELHKKTVAQLREIAKAEEHESLLERLNEASPGLVTLGIAVEERLVGAPALEDPTDHRDQQEEIGWVGPRGIA